MRLHKEQNLLTQNVSVLATMVSTNCNIPNIISASLMKRQQIGLDELPILIMA